MPSNTPTRDPLPTITTERTPQPMPVCGVKGCPDHPAPAASNPHEARAAARRSLAMIGRHTGPLSAAEQEIVRHAAAVLGDVSDLEPLSDDDGGPGLVGRLHPMTITIRRDHLPDGVDASWDGAGTFTLSTHLKHDVEVDCVRRFAGNLIVTIIENVPTYEPEWLEPFVEAGGEYIWLPAFDTWRDMT